MLSLSLAFLQMAELCMYWCLIEFVGLMCFFFNCEASCASCFCRE